MTLLAAVAGAVAISFSAILYALADVSPSTGGFFRLFYALPVLFILWCVRRDQDQRPPRRRMLAVLAGMTLVVGLAAVIVFGRLDRKAREAGLIDRVTNY